jgi:hypothetical protein
LLLDGQSAVERKQGLEGPVRQMVEFGVGGNVRMTGQIVVDSLHQNGCGVRGVRKVFGADGLLKPSEAIKARLLDDLDGIGLQHLCSPRRAMIGSPYLHLILVNESLTIPD